MNADQALKVIDLSTTQLIKKFDTDFTQEVIEYASKFFENVENVKSCIQCATCTGSCPSGRETAWRVRKLIRQIQLGLKNAAIRNDVLWDCTTCYTCQERCPRLIPITDIVRAVRNIAVRNGFMLPRHVQVAGLMIKHGHAVPINDEVKAVRKEIGLSELPPTVHSYPDALGEVKKLLDETGFTKLVEEASKGVQK
ncbi:MAG: CoB--CoM heterodisulfide reductase subunit C [Candidatus Jordarchaeales archaeon]